MKKNIFTIFAIAVIAILSVKSQVINVDYPFSLQEITSFLTQAEIAPRTIYFDSLYGNDISGCGTAVSPFATPERCLQDIKPIIAADIIIQADSFGYEFNYSEISALTRLLTLTNGASLIFKGLTKNYASLTLTKDVNLSTLYTFTGATLSENEIRGMFIIRNANNHLPIATNRNDSLWNPDISVAGSRTIYKNMVTFINFESEQDWLNLPIGNINGGFVQFENIKFDDDNRFNFDQGSNKVYFYRCNFDQPFNINTADNTAIGAFRMYFKQSYFGISTSSLFSRVRANIGGIVEIRDCVFNELTGSEYGLTIQSAEVNLSNVIFNDSYLRIIAGSKVKTTNSITLKDLTNGIVVQADATLSGNEVNSEFIIYNTDNFFSYGDGNQFPEIIEGGFIDVEGTYTNLFAEISGYQALEDYTINLPGLWQKNERIITNITNNTSGNIEIGDTLQNKAIYIDYTVTRQDSTEIGTITLSGRNDTDINNTVDVTFDEAEITFSKNISGSTVRIGYVLSDATYDAELNMVIRRTYY